MSDGIITPMAGDEGRSGYCTEYTGFLPSDRATLEGDSGKLIIDGSYALNHGDPFPILEHRISDSEHDIIYLPYREVLFRLDESEPVDTGDFDETIRRMALDIRNVIAGPFSRICGLRLLKELSGQLAVYVKGMTDRLASEEHNLELSEARATRVATALVPELEKLGGMLWIRGGLSIMAVGVGEAEADTEDGKESPEHRRVELVASTHNPRPELAWAMAGEISPARPQRAEILEYNCMGSDSDCAEATDQCIEGMLVMCSDVYAGDAEARKRCFERVNGSDWSSFGVPDEGMREWIGRGYLRFPIFYSEASGARKRAYSSSPKECFDRAFDIAIENDVSMPPSYNAFREAVIDPRATRGTLLEGTELCTGASGWADSSRMWLSQEPRGISVWMDDSRLGFEHDDVWVAKRNAAHGQDELYMVPWRSVDARDADVEDTVSWSIPLMREIVARGPFREKCVEEGSNSNIFVKITYNPGRDRASEYVKALAGRMKEEHDRLSMGTDSHIEFTYVKNESSTEDVTVSVFIFGHEASDPNSPAFPGGRDMANADDMPLLVKSLK